MTDEVLAVLEMMAKLFSNFSEVRVSLKVLKPPLLFGTPHTSWGFTCSFLIFKTEILV